ncbi:MAG: rhomboid family intramembrane serine protease [Chromatiales bacterium]|jgi:membrane associated rhomboid family serine protease
MLILPLHRKVGWDNLPILTLLLIAANTLIFLLTQLDDDQQFNLALSNYQESGLYEIERGGYLDYLDERNDLDYLTGRHETGDADQDLITQMTGIQSDREFLLRLHEGRVIESSDEGYLDWQQKRTHFESLYESITYVGFGLRAGQPEPLSLFSHMFLHAGFGHLIGNMLFLFALGILIEDLMGRLFFISLYLLGGLGSAGFDILFSTGSLMPGIGASGAIAGLMGMCSVIYGFRRIRFFYSVGFYFDYVSLPAIVLLPLWIGNELFQLLYYTDSNINYLAHLGGLVSGAALAGLIKFTSNHFDLSHLELEEQKKGAEQNLRAARALYQNMEYRKALPLLRRLYQEGCQEREALYLYYQCSRISPQSEDYHKAARALFSIPERDAASAELLREIYSEYIKLARPGPRFNADTVCRLVDCFVAQKWRGEADKLMSIVRKKGLTCPKQKELSKRYAELCAKTHQD